MMQIQLLLFYSSNYRVKNRPILELQEYSYNDNCEILKTVHET